MLQIITQVFQPNSNTVSIFNFTSFLSGLALLGIIYTISNVRYHFRIAIAPFPIYKITYVLIAFIGFGTLITDFYASEGWHIPNCLIDPGLIQTVLAIIFFCLVLAWMWIASIFPLKFNRFNYRQFTQTLYMIIAKGSDNELSVVADEIGRSASSIIKSSKAIERQSQFTSRTTSIQSHVSDLLLMLGHRKFCKHITSNAPGTAIAFFRAMTHYEKYDIPIGQFSVNISVEALKNTDSPLYHEDAGFKSGLFGYIKPFSNAIYGNYILVETLGNQYCSPLDLPYDFTSNWNSKQVQAYCRCTLITIENYLQNFKYDTHSYSITRAIRIIKDSCNDIYKINHAIGDYNSDIYSRIREVTQFAIKVTKSIDKYWPTSLPTYKTTNKFSHNIYDSIAELMFDVISYAAHVTTPPDTCWSLQYVCIWSVFFNESDHSKSLEVVTHKLRRLLFESIIELESNNFPNYQSARILGICLNVMQLTPIKRNLTKNYHSLHKIIIRWVIKNFHTLAIEYPDIAKTCLQGNVSYDEGKNQLIYSYVTGMRKESKKATLQLDQ